MKQVSSAKCTDYHCITHLHDYGCNCPTPFPIGQPYHKWMYQNM